jgi:hypothetical protein
MDVALYASPHGVLLLVPACMHPSRDAERRYGPLQLRGEGQLEDVPDRDCRARIEADLDRCAYSLVHQREARCIAPPPPPPRARRFEANLQNLNTAVISKGFFLIRRSLPRH